MSDNYYIIESGELLEIAEKFRKDYEIYHSSMKEFFQKYDIKDAYVSRIDGAVTALKFNGCRKKDGFLKPNKYGFLIPKKANKEWQEILKSSPKKPQTDDYFHDNIKCPHYISYESKCGNIKGARAITSIYQTYGLYWYSPNSEFLLTMPDVKKAIEDIKNSETKNNINFNNNVENFVVPKGLREILREEWEFIVAKNKKSEKKLK